MVGLASARCGFAVRASLPTGPVRSGLVRVSGVEGHAVAFQSSQLGQVVNPPAAAAGLRGWPHTRHVGAVPDMSVGRRMAVPFFSGGWGWVLTNLELIC